MRKVLLISLSALLCSCSSLVGNKFFDENHKYELASEVTVNNGHGGAGVLPKGTVIYEYRTHAEGTWYYVLLNLNDTNAAQKLEPETKRKGFGWLEGIAK